MAIVEGASFSDLASTKQTADDRLLEYTMDFVFAVEDKLDELGMTKADLAKKLGCKKSQVSHVLSGSENITLKTMARYDAVLGIGLKIASDKPTYRKTFTAPDSAGGWNVHASRTAYVTEGSR